GQKEFLAAFTKKFKHEPPYFAAAGYSGCLLYVEAAKRAGTLEAEKVREELLKLKTRTAFGDYAVDQDGFQTAHKTAMLQWQDGHAAMAGRQAPDRLAGGAVERQAALSDPALEPAIAVDLRTVRSTHARREPGGRRRASDAR